MQIVQILVGRIAAQLVLDRADLLLQEILALLLIDVLLHLTLDFVFQLGDLLLAHQYLQQPARSSKRWRSASGRSMFEQMKLIVPRLLSIFLIAKVASLGICGEILIIFSATSLIESTSASNSMFVGSGIESFSGATEALK